MPADLRCGVHGIVCIALCCGHVRHLPGGKLLRGGVLTAGGKQPYCPAGSSALSVCAAGFYCSDNMKQVQCPAGSWCAEGVSSHAARASGYLCVAGSATNNTVCEAGNCCPEAKEQLLCPLGSYCPEGSTAPIACPECANCPAGSNALPEGLVCPAGSYCADGDLSNEATCKLGNYCPSGSTSDDQKCAAGSYCPSPAQQLV